MADRAVREMPSHPVLFHGTAEEFFKIWVVNLLLSLVTLGIYSAWAKVRTHRYFYGCTELDGDRFEYLAEPLRILKGRIIALLYVVVTGALYHLSNATAIAVWALTALLTPLLLRASLRFNCRVTRFRGVRFDFVGSLKGIYWVALGRPLMLALLIFPASSVVLMMIELESLGATILGSAAIILAYGAGLAWMMRGSALYSIRGLRYGEHAFDVDLSMRVYLQVMGISALIWLATLGGLLLVYLLGYGYADLTDLGLLKGGDVKNNLFVGVFMVIYVGSLVAGALCWLYQHVTLRNYLFNQARLGEGIAFKSAMTLPGYGALLVSNTLLLVCSVGILRPWVMVRTARYQLGCTRVEGELALLARDTGAAANSAIGDEMVEALDLDLGLI
ncbi:YjgN family protein [Aeromonas schubertii]|uniref:YjgN family protein n=1 Tax=Aeromonas schubertii TaxID=652 RepID=UPI001CC43EAB|nr:YjgN family protein [Aeromonas schubertii]MBZ6074353.1 DUF898 domain-containing protein [Aeromonas schubertii]